MIKPLHSALAFASLALGLACTSSNDAPPPAPKAQVRVVHASPDAPAVDVTVNGSQVVANAPYKAATTFTSVNAGMADIRVYVAGTNTLALSAGPTFLAGKYYTVMAVNAVAALEPLVIEEDGVAPASGKLKVRVVHAAPHAPAVDVYVTAPAADLATAMPTLTNVPFKGFSGALEIPAATYQVRVTATGSKTPVYDSGAVPLADGANLVLAAVERIEGAAPITLLGLTREAATPKLEITDSRALVRVKHASPDAPAVDILVNGQAALSNVPFPVASSYLSLAGGANNLKVNVAGTATTVINADVNLVALKAYSVFAVDLVSQIQALVVEDDLMAPSAGKAKLRAIHLSPDAPNVDIWVNGVKQLTNVPFKVTSPYLEVPAGVTDVKVAVTGTMTIVLQATPNLAAGSIYTAAATGTVGAVPSRPLTLNLLTDK